MKKVDYKGGYKYQLIKDATIKAAFPDCNMNNWIVIDRGSLTVQRGYAWDGPSGPTIDTENFMRGSLFHDALYQLMRENRIGKQHRDAADKLLRKVCREDGMSRLRSKWVYLGVKWFGAKNIK
jgi:hypothetical protein